jgi:3-deoxy-D-manno-octulosonate 8-phosphate phosphatase (KDO 8-P phosphatase)
MPEELFAHPDLARIRLLCCDIDGVLTDGGLYYADDGTCFARFHVLDGMGLKRVQAAGVKLAFISQSRTSYIAARARDLGVDFCYTGVENKLEIMTDILSQLDFGREAVAHIADDVNDLSLLLVVGLPITVPGGMPEVKAACRFVTQAAGGNGAVRELCEAILLAKKAQDAV